MAALFWGIRFPFHYRQFKENGYIKYIHIATVATAVLVPLVSGLAPLKDGYVPARFPPILCAARNEDYSFYAVELPISILLPITTSLLFLIFWIILKVQCKLVYILLFTVVFIVPGVCNQEAVQGKEGQQSWEGTSEDHVYLHLLPLTWNSGTRDLQLLRGYK